MICYRCGAPIPDGSNVCAVCGTPVNGKGAIMQCRKCGARLTGRFCSACGTRYEEQPPVELLNSKRGSYTAFIIIAAAALLIIIAVVGIIISLRTGDKTPENNDHAYYDEREEKNEEEVTEKHDEEILLPTEQPTQADDEIMTNSIPPLAPHTVSWMTNAYSDLEIECALPKHFTYDQDLSSYNNALYKAPDSTAFINLESEANISSLSAKDSMDEFLVEQSAEGTLHYSDYDESWYAVSLKYDDWCYYRKCFVDGEKLRWFEFATPMEYLDYYSEYIEYIEDNFRVIIEDATESWE